MTCCLTIKLSKQKVVDKNMPRQIIKLFGFLLLLITQCINSLAQGTDSCVLNLKAYSANICLNDLLASVVKSNEQNYNAKYFFYSLTLTKGISWQLMSITPYQRNQSRFFDYSGILMVKDACFLLRGDFDDGILFKETSNPCQEIKLQGDSKDIEEFIFFREPSLTGAFPICFISNPLFVDVWTVNEIKHYKMKIPLEAKKLVMIYKSKRP